MSSISMHLGMGLYGTPCDATPSPSLVEVFGQPFGHAFLRDLADILIHCDGHVYGETSLFDVSLLSSSHEVACCYHRVYPNNKRHDYRVYITWTKGGVIIFSDYYNFYWDPDAVDPPYAYYHGVNFIGWTPCWWWAGGSSYNGFEEITDDGNDYKVELKLYDVTSGRTEATNHINFSVTGLKHTRIYGNIKNYVGVAVNGDIGIKIIGGSDYYREKNQESSYGIKADGMEGCVDVEIYRSGYKIPTGEVIVVDKSMNNKLDFITLGSPTTTDAGYLHASVEGIVQDADGFAVSNANVVGYNITNNMRYGCKTAVDGKYALPLHYWGKYSINALKNNFLFKNHSDESITQTSKHPSSKTIRDFTGANCINRVSEHPSGAYAHLDSLAVDQQSVIIPDDPITDITQIKPTSVEASIVKVKTRRWGTGAAMGTSSGAADGGREYGSGGFNYDGNIGDAENWEFGEEE